MYKMLHGVSYFNRINLFSSIPLYRVRHKSVNTPLSHERLVGGLQDGGRGTHVTHFVQLYPKPLYTVNQVRTTCRSWDEGVLTDVCLTGVLTDLCLILYYHTKPLNTMNAIMQLRIS